MKHNMYDQMVEEHMMALDYIEKLEEALTKIAEEKDIKAANRIAKESLHGNP